MKVNQPIEKGTNIGSKENGIHWVDCKYERLPTFCYHYGRLGHDEGMCEIGEEDQEGKGNTSKDLGAWLRADVIGFKIKDNKERKEETWKAIGNNNSRNKEGKNEKMQRKLRKKLTELTMAKNTEGKSEKEAEDIRDAIGKGLEAVENNKAKMEARGEDREENEKKKQTGTHKKWKRRAREGERNQQEDTTRAQLNDKRKTSHTEEMEIQPKKHQTKHQAVVVAKQPCRKQ
ncbi:hypothetical protein PIB30_084423 [Stylosanthes scabra]|uniref:Zinc knuckle CX2CX4HX4C domain-containing protein n=1 Tax=Stylosanthes scabra TaxID=79078 RepID=A0ABU6WUA1_9FABA|nr:hypothetical protein [Stylosanthes scabra]